MRVWSRVRSWARAMVRRGRMESEMDAELRFHIEVHIENLVANGVPCQEAVRRARLEFGSIELTKEDCREARQLHLTDTLLQDVRYGLRTLRKNPGFTVITALTLAIGIGANTAIFSAVNTLLLRELPIKGSHQLVFGMGMREGFDPFGMSLLEYAAYRERNHCFARSGLVELRSFNVIGPNEPERVQGAAVQADYLATLGIEPILGRTITAAEDYPGGPAVAMVGYGFWRRRFAGDPQLIGRSLNLNGRLTTVIGVMPSSFDYPGAAEIWIPLQVDLYGLPLAERAAHNYDMLARLRPGVTVEQADAELRGIARSLEQEFPQVRRGWSVRVIPLRQELLQDVAGRVEKSLLALVAAVGFLLLICCANVAGLLLARGVGRERELALRRALGAGRWRIVRQLTTESVLLAVLGGVAGLLLAYAVLPLLSSLNPIQTTGFGDLLRSLHIDARALAFLAVLTTITGVISGILPAINTAAGNNLLPAIQEGGPRSGGGAASRRWLALLVVSEMAIAVTLLAGGGLMMQSFQHLQHMELGFRPESLLTMHMELAPERHQEFPRRTAFVEQILQRIRHLPGVISAGTSTNAPLTSFISYDSVFTVEGHPPSNPAEVPITAHRLVSPDYLQTLGVTLVEGRLLNEHDRTDTLPVAVISEELAKQGWPGEDPLGKRIKRVRPGQGDFPWRTVVGVVKDVKEDRFNFRINRPVWYLPYAQEPNRFPLDLVVKVSGDPASLTPAIRRAILAVDPDQPISNVSTMKADLAGMLVTERFSAILMGALATMGLLLAIIGLYGVIAYSVSRQTGEIGLRVALGARPADISRMVLGRGAKLISMGLLVGVLSAAMLTRLLANTLYNVKANDPATFAAISLLLALVAMAACYLPARRATRVDPMVALRDE